MKDDRRGILHGAARVMMATKRRNHVLVSVLAAAAVIGLGALGFHTLTEADGDPPRVPLWEKAVPATVAPEQADAALGSRIYATHCLGCHGRLGDGQGPASLFLQTAPRDFVSGMFKYHSGTSSLPSNVDLFRTVSVGFPAFGMPSFRYLSETERWAVIAHIKTFHAGWAEAGQDPPLDPGPELTRTEGWEERGRELYATMLECQKCHGETGHADGPSAGAFKDQWGHPIEPVDFSLGPVFRKNGWRARDTVRILMTGISGTPMPAYWSEGDDKAMLWEVAWYVETLAAGESSD